MRMLCDSLASNWIRAVSLALLAWAWSAQTAAANQDQEAVNSIRTFLREAYEFPNVEMGAVYKFSRGYSPGEYIVTGPSYYRNFRPAPCFRDKENVPLLGACFKRFVSVDEQGYSFEQVLVQSQPPGITMIGPDGELPDVVKFSVLATVRVNFADVLRVKKANPFSTDWIGLKNGERTHRTTLYGADGKDLDSFYPSKSFLKALHTLCRNLK